ncbi:cupredoxin domain-containing protein [Methanoregula sp.]|uniref:cupredoxin domain-containing protein n=1 Tax=Methanoregula sp. TaxID=2052170 RepID=UPI0023751FAD|nr:cupredoxin domain-containing protein [Methanoregula sp.]MDD1687365.1 cupredoxin domain-containing protein [Methanoregula sp.]
MKRCIGILILIIVLVAVSGCTQQTTTAPVTTTVPTTVPTEVPTPVETTVETTVAPTTEVTTEAIPVGTIAANETAAATETEVVPATTTLITAGMTPSTKITVIHIANNTFTPSVLMVLPGTMITWTNDEKTVHSVKIIGDHAGKFNSGDIVGGASSGYTFGESEGTFEYTDGYNLNATGVIIVKKGDTYYGMRAATTVATSNSS